MPAACFGTPGSLLSTLAPDRAPSCSRTARGCRVRQQRALRWRPAVAGHLPRPRRRRAARAAGYRPARGASARLPRRAVARRAARSERDRGSAGAARRRSSPRSIPARAPRPRRWRAAARGPAQRMKLRLYHHRDGTRIAYREAGVGPSLCLVHSAGAVAPRVRPGRRAPRRPLSPRAARPAAARRLRGSPAPPVHAGLARRGHGGVLSQDVRAPSARRRPWRGRGDPAARDRHRAARAGAARADAQPPAPPAAPLAPARAAARARAGAALPGLDRAAARTYGSPTAPSTG